MIFNEYQSLRIPAVHHILLSRLCTVMLLFENLGFNSCFCLMNILLIITYYEELITGSYLILNFYNTRGMGCLKMIFKTRMVKHLTITMVTQTKSRYQYFDYPFIYSCVNDVSEYLT